jgi:sulfatase maturation enzyme AslB (radical SAM superfamily)
MKNYCRLIFQNLYVEKTNNAESKLGFCCMSKTTAATDTVTFTHPTLESGRKHLIDTGELPPACSLCINTERNGSVSPRLNGDYNDFTQGVETKLTSIHYNCDTVCNLKCIMCSGQYSSTWIEDEIKLGTPSRIRLVSTKNNTLAYNLDLSDIKSIYFNGGEPFMSLDHIKFLTHVIEHADPSKISINYNTNATWPITQAMLDIWDKFLGINVMCSIDGIGEVFEYVRFPGNWQSVSKNLLDFKKIQQPNVHFMITPAIGIHNILYVDQLLSWCAENNFSTSFDDEFSNINTVGGIFSLNDFPKEHHAYLLDYLSSISLNDRKHQQLIAAITPLAEQTTIWIDQLTRLDRIRGNNWKKSLSRLYKLNSKYFDKIIVDTLPT